MMKRRSVRHFKDTVIPEHLINQLLDAANNAPSGGNIQPISIIIIQDRERKSKLSQLLGGQLWVEHAPLTMIFCLDFFRLKKWASMSDTKFLGEKSLSHFLIAYADVICASQNVVILAESLGLGSVYIGVVQSVINQVRSFFSIPELVLPLMVLCLGYPASVPKNIPKLNRNVIVHEETYKMMSDQEIIEAYNLKYGEFEEDPEKYLEKAYKINSKYIEVLQGIGKSYFYLKNYNKSLEYFEDYNEIDKDDTYCPMYVGIISIIENN